MFFNVPLNSLDLGMRSFVPGNGVGWGVDGINWDITEVLRIQGESFPSEVRPDAQPSRRQDGDTSLEDCPSFREVSSFYA